MSRDYIRHAEAERGIALFIALIVLMLISAAAAAIMFMSGGESSLVGNQRSYTLAWDAAAGGLEEARARLSAGDPNFIGQPATTIAFPAARGDVLYILNNPGGTFTVNDVTNSTSQYYDWEYDLEWGSGALASSVSANTVKTVSSDTLLSSLSGMLPSIPYKWVRVTILTERAANRDINGDSTLDNTTPVFYDLASNTQNVMATSPRPGNTLYRLTSLATLPNGTSSVLQYDVGPGVPIPQFPAAISLCGSSVSYGAPHSNNWVAQGQDSGTPPGPSKEGIGTCNPASTTSVSSSIPGNRLDHYTGSSGLTPDVVDVSSTMGPCLQSVSCLQNLVATLTASADQVLTGPVSPPSLGTDANPLITVVNGDCSLTNGSGILVVTGTLTASGNTGFNGIILVIGQGSFQANGGGNGQYNGTIFVAKTLDASGNPLASLGTATMNWNGGGGNGVHFNSQYINAMNNRFPYKTVGFRELTR